MYLFPGIVLGMRLSVYATDQCQHQYQYNVGISGTLLNSSQTTPTSSLEGDQIIKMYTLFTPPLHTHSQLLLLLLLKLPISADIEFSLLAGVTVASLAWVGVCGSYSAGQCGGVAPAGLQRALQHHPDLGAALCLQQHLREGLPSEESHLHCAWVIL